ncbi:MAG: YARHG domain-containing protein [Butyricicoccus sp.]
MFCTHCGAELPEGACFCPVCGRSAEPAAPQKTDSEQPPTIQEQIAPPPHYDDLDEIDRFDDEPPRRPIGMIAAAAAAVVIVLAVVIALVKLHPWTLLADMDRSAGAVSSEVSDSDSRPADEQAVLTDADDVPATDWRDYDGAWEADGLIFALEMLDGEVNVTLHSLDDTYWDAAEPEGDTVDVRLRGMEIRLKAGKDRALRIAIDGKPFEAVRYTGKLDTKADPPTAMTGEDSGYLYYSASTGTRSTDDVIPNDRDLHFWPLDQFAIAASDLDRLTQNEIDIIRNEAFARHGYVFATEAWQNFFRALDWYTPDPKFTEARFSKLEKQNIDTIVAYEKARGWL